MGRAVKIFFYNFSWGLKTSVELALFPSAHEEDSSRQPTIKSSKISAQMCGSLTRGWFFLTLHGAEDESN